MIIQFSLSNYRSVFHRQTLNFRATSLVSEDKQIDQQNIADVNDYRILKSIGIYGANASGKTNIIRGFAFFQQMVQSSLTSEDLSKNEFSPFKQSTEKTGHFGFFEVILLLDLKKYRYGFTLNESSNIEAEWLFGPADKKETFYFTRKNDEILINPIWFQEADDLPKEKVRSNALFLSFCASYDGKISTLLKTYISEKISVDIGSINRRINHIRTWNNRSTDSLIESGNKNIILKWMKEAGLNFSDIRLDKIEIGGKFYGNFVSLAKTIYNQNGESEGDIMMNLDEHESDGTRKFYSYIGQLYDKFQNGGMFISDEIDSNFHPSLLQKLIRYFNNPNVNKANAQILFTSHDTNLMHPEIMRRDQFYFTEKSNLDETILYSLADLKGIRNNADFARQYLAGLYGALPILGDFLEDNNQ